MTMRDLANEMECKVSNIYNYIKSKQGILDKLLFEISQKFHDGIQDIENSSYGPLEKLKAIISLHVRMTVDHPYQIQLLTFEWRHLETKRKAEFIKLRELYEHKLRSVLQAGLENQELEFNDPEFSMHCMLSSIRWIYSWYSPEKVSGMNPIEIEKNMTDFILNGLLKRKL